MYRVMIVDDAEEIRKGIRLKADWQHFCFDVCAEAGNGREALAILEQQDVDLIVTDIHMPVLNGLDLLRECSVHHPHTKLIVLSGYDDFQYVKTAMQCGAIDYLLKPVVVDELESLLVKVKNIMDEERYRTLVDKQEWNRQSELQREQFILQLAKEGSPHLGETIDRAERLKMNRHIKDSMQAYIVTIEMRIPDGRLDEPTIRPDLMRTAFQLLCREIAGKYEDLDVFHDWNHPSMMHYLFYSTSTSTSTPTAYTPWPNPERFGVFLQREIARYLQLESVIGIGHMITSPLGLRSGYESSLLAWSQSDCGNCSQIKQLEEWADSRDVPAELERKLDRALEKGDRAKLEATLEDWLSSEKTSMYAYHLVVMKLIMYYDSAMRRYQLEKAPIQDLIWGTHHLIRQWDSNTDIKERMLHIGQLMIESIRKSRLSSGEEIVLSICRYVDEHYASELSLSGLAEKFYINAAYLSDLFHRQTGKTYSQYVFEVRMKRAQLLLDDSQLRVADIAALVGFPNAAYFCTVFKRFHGISPAEYRDHKKMKA